MEEFKVRAAPKVTGRKLSVFKMHKDDHVTWAEAKMKRDNEYQPWQIKTGSGRTSKRFKATKEGGVDENSDFFIFYKPKGSTDTYEVCPVDEWYNIKADKRYKTLTAEEAEEKYLQINKNYRDLTKLMPSMRKAEGGEEGFSANESKSFKISEMDEWEGDDDDFSGSENGDAEGDDAESKKKAKKKSVKKEKGDPDDAPEEGKEDSDEGDFEQREVDYMSETSSDSSQSEKGDERDEVKGIDEEQALRDLLTSDEEEDAEGSPEKEPKSASVRNPSEHKQDPDGDGSDESSDNDDDDYDVDEDEMDSRFMKKSLPAQLVKQETKQKQEPAGASGAPSQQSSSSQKPSTGAQQGSAANKRKLADSAAAATTSATGASTSAPMPPSKRHCPPDYPPTSSPNTIDRTIEEQIKKYLRRKPTTLKTLLRDIKAKLKRNGGTDSELKGRIHSIADIIKRLNPEKQKLNDETYLFLKS